MKKYFVCLYVLVLVCASCASTRAGVSPDAGGSAPAAAAETARNTPIPVEVKISVFFADGSLDEYTTSEYDDSLTLLENQKRFSASEALLEETEFSYMEEKGWLTTKITRDDESRLKTRVVFQYNEKDQLWKETIVNKSGKAISSYEYVYDAGGNRIRRIINSGANIKMAETVYTLDSKGLAAQSETRDSSGNKINSTENRYDGDNHLISQTVTNADGQISAVISYVWKDGLEISSEQAGADGSPQMRITNEYGNSGELLKKTIENLQGNSTRILEYEYTFKPARR